MLRAMKLEPFGRDEVEGLAEKAAGPIQVQDGERDGAGHRRDTRPRALAGPRVARIVLHELDEHPVCVANAGTAGARLADRVRERWRSRRAGPLEGGLEILDGERDHRVADVAGPPVAWQAPHQRAAELEQLELELFLAVDEPPAGRSRPRQTLDPRSKRPGEEVRAARRTKSDHLPVPAMRSPQIDDAERDLAEAHARAGSRDRP